ncbi:hypothetical protein QVN83_02630 [Yersinia frederiksenii]|uniref:hypothetical protein n=1 Tax=Yersinia frederiksenii TaxID=29484 RepID=UPI0025AA4542|nr:hypothetical protein [Yersinia frederiksenii]MDN0117874.1 hypothetical protein [Yersinia frederiksenii]
MAHAVLGAVVGHFNGNATVGAVSAFTAEAATPEIAALLKAGMEYCAGSLFLCVNNLGLQASEIIVPGGVGAGGAIGVGKTVAEATAAKAEAAAVNSAKEVWKGSSVQSRVNLRNGDGSTASGLEYAWKKHGGEWGANKSHFTMTKDELKTVLQSDTVVKTPVQYSPSTGNYIHSYCGYGEKYWG